MERERLPIKKLITSGILQGLFFATAMAAFDYFENESFSIKKFLFYSIIFGFFMAISFRFKYSKQKNKPD